MHIEPAKRGVRPLSCSSVPVGENIHGNPMLSTIFEELMRTSQIQRMLYKMKSSGLVTSQVISEAYQRVDKAVDLFYLAVQMNAVRFERPLNDDVLFSLRVVAILEEVQAKARNQEFLVRGS